MTIISARILLDSVSTVGARITTLELTYPRFPVHEQILTHRVFSRNAMSSRAIKMSDFIAEVVERPALPLEPRYEERGMQGYKMVEGEDFEWVNAKWLEARDAAVRIAEEMAQRGIHKQTVNRLLQPFAHIQVILTSTQWSNFFNLRLEHDTQPETQAVARAMLDALNNSVPVERDIHLPLMDLDGGEPTEEAWWVSAARCARVTTGNQHAVRLPEKEAKFAQRLWDSGHLSPFEHLARATADRNFKAANFVGWASYRFLGGR